MKKLDKLKTKCKQAKEARVTLAADIDKLKAQAERLAAEAEKFAAAGDLAEYKAHKASADSVAAELYVKRKQLEACENPITLEEAREAWTEYAAQADKKTKAQWAEYQRQRAALLAELRKLADIMRANLAEREAIAAGIKGYNAGSAKKDFPLFTIEARETANDRILFHRADMITLDELTEISSLFS